MDVPELDAVLFADPRDSGTDVVQAVGRALRRGSRQSKIATIIIPVLMNVGDVPETALGGSEFGAVWRVVRALRAHDERMAAWLDEYRIAQSRNAGREPVPESPGWLAVTGAPTGTSFAAALQVRIVGEGTSPWLDGYAQATAWHKQHGHLLVPNRHVTADGYPLGQWIGQQRNFRKKGILAQDRITRLDELFMAWGPRDAAWLDGMSRLRAWRGAHGHLDVPRAYEDSDGFPLGTWTADLRPRRASLPPDKIAALDDLGMLWKVTDYRWQAGLEAARAYHAEHGDLEVPEGCTSPGGLQLRNWITGMRRKRDRGTLEVVQIAELDKLGIRWFTDRGWTQGLEAARAYHAEHGHINVPKGHPPVLGIRLDNWLVTRRQQHHDGTLDPARAKVLEQLGITWRHADRAWDDALQALTEYKQAHGHADVPKRQVTPGGYRLGQWLSRQRSLRNAGTLPPDRVAALDKLGVSWAPPSGRKATRADQ